MASASASATPSSSSPKLIKRPQPIPWTHQETVNLIRAYQEKWYSLKRGPLRTSQWEEVAVVVAARCGYDFDHPSKSALQCRHKMEKLRQRHRAEKHRLSAASSRSWQYLGLMDDLQRGPLPISASLAPPDSGDDDESQRPTARREHVWDDDENDDDADEEEEEGKGLVSGLTAEIRDFAERIAGLENLKMEMMKETERFRLEMENKRIRMILRSQWRTLDSIRRAFASSKRIKVSPPPLL